MYFPYFHAKFPSVNIFTDGYLTFGNINASRYRVIATEGGKHTTIPGGMVGYQRVSDPSELVSLNAAINNGTSALTIVQLNFSATAAFVVTWNSVFASSTNQTNTFQLVLVTDGTCNIIFKFLCFIFIARLGLYYNAVSK